MGSDSFRHVDPKLVHELHAALLSSRCSPRALLAGVDPALVASLDDGAPPSEYLLAALHRLNEIELLRSGEVPFEVCLANARTLAGHLPEGAVVERAIDALNAGRRARRTRTAQIPRTAGHAPAGAPSRPAASPARTMPLREGSLVVLDGAPAEMIGTRKVLTLEGLSIGRGTNVDWSFEHWTVSRRHCRIVNEGGQWILRDGNSTNGTLASRYVDESTRQPVGGAAGGEEGWVLHAGDLIEIGDVSLRVLPWTARSLHDPGDLDPLTGVWSRARIVAALESEVARWRDGGPTSSALAIGVDQVLRDDDDQWDPVGDAVLRRLGSMLWPHQREHVDLGRYDGRSFLFVLKNTERNEVLDLAHRLIADVRASDWSAFGRALRVTISIAALPIAMGAESIAAEIGRTLDGARLAAGDRIVEWEHESIETTLPKRIADAVPLESLYGHIPALPPGGTLAAIYIDPDGGADRRLLLEWEQQLLGLLTRRGNRYPVLSYKDVLFVPLGLSAHEAAAWLDDIRAAWATFPVPVQLQHALGRSLHTAVMSSTEIREHGIRAFEELAARLDAQRRPTLPFPLSAPLRGASTHASEYMRARALGAAVDVAMRFVAAVQLSALRASTAPDVRSALASVVARYADCGPLPVETWWSLAGDLARLASQHVRGALGAVGASLQSEVGADLDEIILLGQRYLSRDTLQHASAYAKDVRFFEALLARLPRALDLLAGFSLVSVASIDGDDEDDGVFAYRVHVHQGPSELFPLEARTSPVKLAKNGWCYLIGGADQRPLSLAPLVAAWPCARCSRVELFMADGLASGSRGTTVPLRALTTSHEVELPVAKLR